MALVVGQQQRNVFYSFANMFSSLVNRTKLSYICWDANPIILIILFYWFFFLAVPMRSTTPVRKCFIWVNSSPFAAGKERENVKMQVIIVEPIMHPLWRNIELIMLANLISLFFLSRKQLVGVVFLVYLDDFIKEWRMMINWNIYTLVFYFFPLANMTWKFCHALKLRDFFFFFGDEF